ncbi:MAG: hypothetical protein ACXVO9_04320 [Bacteroidia bacterium]
MKTRNTLIKTFLVFGLSFSFFTGKSATTPEKEILIQTEKTIQSFFTNLSLTTGEKKVEILFTTGENGMINFVLVKTTDETLKKEIEKQFYTMSFPLLTKNSVNSVVLSFKTK